VCVLNKSSQLLARCHLIRDFRRKHRVEHLLCLSLVRAHDMQDEECLALLALQAMHEYGIRYQRCSKPRYSETP